MASPISAQQRSVKESRRQFDTRMLNMVSLMQSTEACFFYKIVSKTMATEVVQGPFAYSLEFPINFVKQHGKKFDTNVTFVIKDSKQTWPIKLTIRSFKHSKPRTFAYGLGGWKTFLMDNHIKMGDVLIFSLIGHSQFQVLIGRAPSEVHRDDDDDDEDDDNMNEDEDENNKDKGDNDEDCCKSSTRWFRNASPCWNADQAPDPCRVCKQAPACPRFVVAIHPSSHSQHSSLAVPGHFWNLYGNVLECNDLQLRGPNKAIFTVKTKRTYDAEGKLSVRLVSGWNAFFVAHELRVGDLLEFFLVANSCFTVNLAERI